MSYIISPSYLLRILICASLPWKSLLVPNKISLFFFNGVNIIRCSDQQVQVYTIPSSSKKVISNTVTCIDLNSIHNGTYLAYDWGDLKLICSTDNSKVQEEQIILWRLATTGLPTVEAELAGNPYLMELESEKDKEFDTLTSEEQPADDTYYNVGGSKSRTIFLRFPSEPMTLCMISFTSSDKPCPSSGDAIVNDAAHICFYDPWNNNPPTVDEMLAEMNQINANKPADGSSVFLLDLEKPAPLAPNASINALVDPLIPSKHSSSKAKKGKKKNTTKIIGVLLIVLFIVGLIGVIGFFLFRKHRANQSLSSSAGVEKGNKNRDSSRLDPNQSQQSLATNDSKSEIQSTIQEKPSMELQQPGKNQRARAGTLMGFNEDL